MDMSETALRKYIRLLIQEEKKRDDLLTEPDDVEDPEPEEEASTVAGGAVRGVSTPLGAGPTYPKKSKRKNPRQDTVDVVKRAFGNASEV